MGLAERKVKQRIGHDPRNLSWSGDTNRFSYKHMTALGWSGDKGLGANADGNPNHIAVARKLDNGGIGMTRARKEGDDNAAGAGQAGRGLEDVLKRLAAASASASPSPAPESPAESSDKEQKKRNKIASRQRHLQSKRLASSSPAALAEILGVPISSLPASPSSSAPGTPAESTPEPDSPAETLDPETDRTAEETVKKSTLSVADYFKQKMREKMLARQAAAAANGTAPVELAADSLAALKEDKPKVAIGGVAWEGNKMAFEEEKVDLGDLGTEAGPSTPATPEVDEKAAKKAKKEAKRLKKLAESASASPAPAEASNVETSVEDAETKAKREKKERKEDKKRKRDEEAGEVKDEGKKDKKDKKRKRDDDSGEKKSKKDKKDKERKSKEE